jgi:mono/diheme cytochrome c family protein
MMTKFALLTPGVCRSAKRKKVQEKKPMLSRGSILRHICTGFSIARLLAVMGACTPYSNPLDDYEELESSTMMEAPQPDPERQASYDPDDIQRGKYLVELLACGSCHTDGALIGMPNHEKSLAGSHVGIAYSNPLEHEYPGVVYPANLTPDQETGIGSWTDLEIKQVIRTGVDNHGRRRLSVMPFPAYARITDEDATVMVAYLRSLAPIRHVVPANVQPGQKAASRFVHFGVYQSRER